MRAFISIDIPDNLKKEILNIQNKLPEFEGKKTETENLHLTLKFLGWVNEDKIAQVKKRLSEIKFNKFETQLDKFPIFKYLSPLFHRKTSEFMTLFFIH